MHLAHVLALVAIAAGCAETPTPAPQPLVTSTSGALTVNWTIKGAADPNECLQAAAGAVEITVLDSSNQRVGSYEQSCSAFATSIALDAGIYSAEARLIGVAGVPRARSVRIDSLTINGNSELTAPIDFPEDSLLF